MRIKARKRGCKTNEIWMMDVCATEVMSMRARLNDYNTPIANNIADLMFESLARGRGAHGTAQFVKKLSFALSPIDAMTLYSALNTEPYDEIAARIAKQLKPLLAW